VAIATDTSGALASLPTPSPITVRNDRRTDDKVFRGTVRAAGYGSLVLLFFIGLFLLLRGWPALHLMGWRFFTTSGYPTAGKPHPSFGVEASLYGSVVVAVVALAVGVPVAVTTSLFLSEYAPQWSRRTLIAIVDLAAAVPSVIYGLWGFFELQPNIVGFSTWLSHHLAFIPIFKVVSPPLTASLFIAGLVVGIMIVPIIASITREVFSLAPPGEREGALALGASRFQMIRSVVLPFGRGGMIGAIMLGLGRALGETIAVAIILGETFAISPHILQHGGTTIASLIAIHFPAGGPIGIADDLMCGFVLFLLTIVINLAASAIINRSRSGAGVEL
jgi:phosphate transport system permease protein